MTDAAPLPPEAPPFPPSPLRIAGLGLVLRQWTEDDLDAMVEAYDDPEVDRWTPIPSPFTREVAAERLVRATVDQAAGQRICLAVTEDGGAAVGEVLIFRDTAWATGGEIGYGLNAKYRGNGYASRAVRLMTEYAYETIGLDRLVLRIDHRNAASNAVARATGYVPDGMPPQMRMMKGREFAWVTWVHQRV